MPESDLAATRRQFLGFLAASPALALAGTGTGLVQRLLAATTDGASHAQQADLVASATEALSVFDFQAVARQVLPTAHYAYLATSVDDDRMLEVNREGFRQFQLRMRRLVDVRTIDTSVDIFGSRWETPIVIQPTGSNGAFHPDAELAVARAAKAKGHLQMLSTVASTPIEEVIAARGGPIWFQLYAATDWTLTEAMVRRAEAAGAAAVVLTVDLQAGSNRLTALRGIRADDRDCALCHDPDQPRAMHTHLDPSSFVTGGRPPRTGPSRPVGMTWDYVTRLKNATSMKVLVKGIVTGEDASLSEAYGADGIVVSNHGARAGATDRSTIEALPEIVEAVGGRMPIIIDSGFRRGTDIFKALALGATAVGIGRPYLWGLASFGQAGVAAVLGLLRRELEMVMRQAGATSVARIMPSHILRRG
ncbi:MAG: alpha-hydroxy acid oxidase [Vicinamibacterales bacterium]|jgi:isopentenyl diphosphate isomerase/L-lactate dehydrogenase-like FMN-dependent dehydrogenase|nr:alpha-hydroxy-acid oxidizing enzyme [Acidobacteriota bacterium]MDP7295365.1 alpha-hydroxy acid oxidase [Vicinamibacterales bacterium]MDP7473000.1 alpha-hydroxy acid oxidase [Vicinamibacterales bacterium]MDP7673071.1 alpha-hydroxy acid oxidase [Vicinamibacterales bacterium]HJO37880.1 alpha-hydroxy acid oxidase [Vicinamibacterales bacterium]